MFLFSSYTIENVDRDTCDTRLLMFHMYLRSDGVYDVISLLFADPAMGARVIGY